MRTLVKKRFALGNERADRVSAETAQLDRAVADHVEHENRQIVFAAERQRC